MVFIFMQRFVSWCTFSSRGLFHGVHFHAEVCFIVVIFMQRRMLRGGHLRAKTVVSRWTSSAKRDVRKATVM